ncbi:MAG: hypothetical protein HZB95_01890 [Nitrosomonadales bacterium]|nr:hypothetical protein [Nitrosomonadales bacterium]
MSDENNQPDLQDRELLPARSKVSLSREIGEAVVTETIFGRARVRIIRKHDGIRRALWQLALAAAGAVALWQGWLALQPVESPTAAPEAGLSATVPESEPASQPAVTHALAAPSQPASAAVMPHSAVQPLQTAAPVPAKPLLTPLAASAPAVAAAYKPLPSRLPASRTLPASAPAAAVAPAGRPVLPSAASSPIPVIPLASPLAAPPEQASTAEKPAMPPTLTPGQ